MKAFIFAILALLASVALAQVNPPCGSRPADFNPIAPLQCTPTPRLTATTCNNLNRRCMCQHNIGLKWTGRPCPGGRTDGGCRCALFCAYRCQNKCNNDVRNACRWEAANRRCVNRVTGDPEVSPVCSRTFAPTTRAPTQSPTTARPSVAPTIPSPTVSPTVPQPSAAPSKAPSRTPSVRPTRSPIIPTHVPSRSPGAALCVPRAGLTNGQCAIRQQFCASEFIPMKFVGAGCVVNGVRLRDGGCQCKGYCGYGCSWRCSADPECTWHADIGKCVVNATGQIGGPIPFCPHEYPAAG